MENKEVKSIKKVKNKGIKNNKPLYLAAIGLLSYGVLEICDCIAIFLIAIGAVPNLYLDFGFIFSEMQSLLENTPIYLFPIFCSFTSMRITSAIGILKNRMWGFWMGIFVSGITLCVMYFFLPPGGLDGIFSVIIVILMFYGYCGNQTIIKE